MLRCVICGADYNGHGNNAEPIRKGRCCDKCNSEVIIPFRIGCILNQTKIFDATKKEFGEALKEEMIKKK